MNQPPSQTPRPGVMALNITSKSALYAAYMPFINSGGLFIPTSKPYKMGDEVFMMLQLLDDPQKHPLSGKVIWVTPKGAQGGKHQGIGVQLSNDQAGAALRTKIEQVLGAHLGSARPTQTI